MDINRKLDKLLELHFRGGVKQEVQHGDASDYMVNDFVLPLYCLHDFSIESRTS